MRPRVTLDSYPPVLRIADYCAVLHEGERTVRRQLAAGTCRVSPRMVRPYRWLRVDLEQYLSTVTVTDDRRAHRLRRVS